MRRIATRRHLLMLPQIHLLFCPALLRRASFCTSPRRPGSLSTPRTRRGESSTPRSSATPAPRVPHMKRRQQTRCTTSPRRVPRLQLCWLRLTSYRRMPQRRRHGPPRNFPRPAPTPAREEARCCGRHPAAWMVSAQRHGKATRGVALRRQRPLALLLPPRRHGAGSVAPPAPASTIRLRRARGGASSKSLATWARRLGCTSAESTASALRVAPTKAPLPPPEHLLARTRTPAASTRAWKSILVRSAFCRTVTCRAPPSRWPREHSTHTASDGATVVPFRRVRLAAASIHCGSRVVDEEARMARARAEEERASARGLIDASRLHVWRGCVD